MKVRNSSRGRRIVAAVPTMFGSTKCRRPRAGPAARRLTSYWPRTLRPRKASMKPSCWLPTVRFSQRDMARPAVSGPSWSPSSVRSMRSKRRVNVARLRSTHSSAVHHGRHLERFGQLRADLRGHDRLDAQQRGPVEGLGLGPLAPRGSEPRPRRAGGARSARTASQSISRVPGAAHDLARRDAGAEGEQTADDDAGGELCGVASHRAQSRGSAAPTGSISTDSTAGSPIAEEALRDGDERRHVPGRGDPARGAPIPPPRAPARRARRAGPRPRAAVVKAESTTATGSPTIRSIGPRRSG